MPYAVIVEELGGGGWRPGGFHWSLWRPNRLVVRGGTASRADRVWPKDRVAAPTSIGVLDGWSRDRQCSVAPARIGRKASV